MNTPCESELIKTQEKNRQCFSKPFLVSRETTSLLQAEQLKNADTVLDRFIPLRMKENLQAKFEAVSHNQTEFLSQKLPSYEQPNDLGQPATRARASQPYLNIFGSETTPAQILSTQQPVVAATLALESTFSVASNLTEPSVP